MTGYGPEWPEEGELVVCAVKKVKNFGAFVALEEYGEKEGFIHIAEVARGWIKYIRDYVREGQKVVCKVLRVDPSKGHIDLSLKAVNEHQKREKIQEWKNAQKAEKLLELVASRLDKDLEWCYTTFVGDLVERFGSLYTAFEECAIDEDTLPREGFKGKWTEAFLQVSRENIVPPMVKINGYLEMTCPRPDGVVHIKDVLLNVQKEDGVTVKVQYIGAPRYRIVVRAPDYKTAEEELQKAASKAIEDLKTRGGDGTFQRRE
ncbi:MAG: translation initiation factor IF-2 subunit alpha [Thermoplasmata archaeon]